MDHQTGGLVDDEKIRALDDDVKGYIGGDNPGRRGRWHHDDDALPVVQSLARANRSTIDGHVGVFDELLDSPAGKVAQVVDQKAIDAGAFRRKIDDDNALTHATEPRSSVAFVGSSASRLR